MEEETSVSLTDAEWAVVCGALIVAGRVPLAGRIREQLFEKWEDE